MSAESANPERARRAPASSCSSTVVLTRTRAMPLVYHICATSGAVLGSPARNVTERLDSALKEQLRAVLDGRAVTEAQLRKLSDDGRSSALVLGAQLERAERRLEELSADPVSPLSEIADTLRTANELRPGLDELERMLADLDERAREARAGWLAPR